MNIYAKKIEAEDGEYIEQESGKRFQVLYFTQIIDPFGRTPQQLGYAAFPSLEACLAAWGLEATPE